jgi:hypothetical protein
MAAVSSTVKKVIADGPPPPKVESKPPPRPDFRTQEWTFIEPSDFRPASQRGTTTPSGTGDVQSPPSSGTAAPPSGSQPVFGGGQSSDSWESLGGGSSSGSGSTFDSGATSESGGFSTDGQETLETEGPIAW